jgi:hypothetical protein
MIRQPSYDDMLRRDARIGKIERALCESGFGALVGAVTGAVGGLPGVIAGSIMGFLVGLLAGVVAAREDIRAMIRERRLDAEIGVTRGTLGTKWVRHVPPRIAAYSFPSSGGRTAERDTIPSEGPMPEGGANWW